MGSATYGVANAVALHAVRVLNCDGIGSFSGVIAGVDWVTINHVSPAVANMSLSGGFFAPLNAAVAGSVASGVTYAVAAGNNSGGDACARSPASEPSVLTVGATDITDVRAGFSNIGTCLDLFAPGVGITSSTASSDVSFGNKSGTSMSSPHVAGVVALYLADDGSHTPATVMAALVGNATADVVLLPGNGSPNLLLFSRLSAPPPPLDVHVASIDVSKSKAGRNTTGFANVTIHDDGAGPVGAATVTGNWFINGGLRVAGTQGVTGPGGMTAISSGPMSGVKGKDVIQFCVTDVTGDGLTYDLSSNLETCDVVGGGDPEPPPPEGFTLGAKVKRRTRVELKWAGSSAASFDIYREGTIIATDPASPYVDQPGSGTWTYKVCEAGTSTCTNDATVRVK